MSPYLTAHMTAEQQLKNDYPKMFRNGFIWALVIHALAFLFLPDIKPTPYRLRERPVVEAIDIPDQFEIPPPPKEEVKPEIPTEIAPSDEASEEETIAATTFEVDAPPELPPAPQRPQFFTAFDEPPQVVRQVPPEYPELARQSETEGVVLVQIGVNEFGDVIEATVVQGVPMLSQAAVEAVMQWKFRPAKQRDVPVPVRIVVPIRFSLRG
jgi:protein TonB